MATQLSLLSMNQHQKLAQQQQNPPIWPWNDLHDGGDDSWEVRAFAEDTSSVTGTTWPPRSYLCSFCRREFRSAQALGGHMNVHRRDRAKLNQLPLGGSSKPTTSALRHSSMKFSSPTSEIGISNGGQCLIYPMLAHGSSYDHGSYGFIVPLGIIKGGDQGGDQGGDHNGFHKMEEELDLELRLGR